MASDAVQLAEKAIEFEKKNKYDAAIYYYGQAAEAILNAVKQGSVDIAHRKVAEEYINRAEVLKRLQSHAHDAAENKSGQARDLERAEFLLYQALDEDEEGNTDEAVQLYAEAVEVCLQARKATDNTDLQGKLNSLAARALERAEHLKLQQQQIRNSTQQVQPAYGSTSQPALDDLENLLPDLGRLGISTTLDDDNHVPIDSSPATAKRLLVTGKVSYSKDELAVLRATSIINGREYVKSSVCNNVILITNCRVFCHKVPFMDVDLREKFAFPVPYTDKHGLLALAQKQKDHFKKWVRPDDIFEQPTIIDKIDSGTIKQTIISDCSFVASLAIAARYERRHNKKLVTSIIYPQNKRGEPVYNPCGKYMVKFNLNGVPRKVIIDDYLPTGKYGELLCSYSQHRGELWVSLLEKAYMKVMGGYDFPGSNSNIDLHALTGWIPERIGIRPKSPEFNKDGVFEKLFDRYHRGDCLITIATGPLPASEQDRAGLVECHAYAMLDIRKVKDKRLFLVKNPWTHLRWKGRYSERDAGSWTPELRRALDYNPDDAQQYDDGVFWIDYDSVCNFFDVFYVNWNPALFKYTYSTHAYWHSGAGPAKDLFTISANPQYCLEIENRSPSAAVWILLTRHITDKNDFAENKEYIAVLVYKNNGKRVYYPFDPPPYIDGTRINSPHYLCKMVLNEPGRQRYTLVISQYEKMNTIYYTLRAYSTCEFRLTKIDYSYQHKKSETGEWKGRTAGGCANNKDTYGNNPIYQLSFDVYGDDNDFCMELKGPKQYSVGFDVVPVSVKGGKPYQRQSSGSYRPGYCVLCTEKVPAGTFNIIPTTYVAGQEGPFILTIESTCQFKFSRLQ